MPGKPNRPIRPRGGAGPRGKRRVAIDQGGNRPGGPPGRQGRGRQEVGPPKQPREVVAPTGPVTVQSGVTVRDYSQALGVPMPELIKILMNLGQMRTATQSLSDEEVELIAAELKREVTIKHVGEEDEEPEGFEDAESDLALRPPVVTIMGHVDHGKTSLLDAVRQTAVVETEAGGITQHIGAYQVEHNGRRITFIDTPGHEAFTAMRARGAKVTDIAVLVVAADDGVMPQTIEAIDHARAAKVPIIIAVNKIDKADANPDRVKTELSEHGVVIEEFGGETPLVPVSARTGEGLNDLIDTILIVADVQELKANPNRPAVGTVVESELDKGRGPVATVLVQTGTLKVGDVVVVGDTYGRIRALQNSLGERITQAGPSSPAVILGLAEVPAAGDTLRVIPDEKTARTMIEQRRAGATPEQTGKATLEDLYRQIQAGQTKELRIVLKADVQG